MKTEETIDIDVVKANEILAAYRQTLFNTREALRLTEMPEPMIIANTINFPDLKKLLPEDVVKFYNELKTMIVLYLDELGFSHQEIARRIGGHSQMIVNKILGEKVRSSEK